MIYGNSAEVILCALTSRDTGCLFAASVFAIIPVVIMFMSIEKNLTEGLTSGGVKG